MYYLCRTKEIHMENNYAIIIIVGLAIILFINSSARIISYILYKRRERTARENVGEEQATDDEEQTENASGPMNPLSQNPYSLSYSFRKWIKIEYWVSLIVNCIIVLAIADLFGHNKASLWIAIGGIALSIVFANVKKYFFLVVLAIYEKLGSSR